MIRRHNEKTKNRKSDKKLKQKTSKGKIKKKKRSVQGHMGDALALGGEEGRDKLR